uniref:Dihydrodipicolinate synthase family protein n=1 Tax=Arcella intermedia TaxID=1963864 RepID=A0A6B2LBM6_9EUKA
MANQIQVNGVTILGVLGEANRVTDKEREEIIRTAVGAAAGRIPVIVGTSHPGTKATIELSLMAQELGARGVMVTPSREPTPSDQKVLEYFQRVGEGIAVPIVLQDHPASTLVHMPVPLVAEIINSVPRVACLKAEAVPTAARIAGMKKAMRRECKVLCGLGALYGGFELKAGCDGFMTGFAFPEVLQLLVELTGKGDWEEVERIYGKFLRLIVYEQQPGVAIRKEFLRRRGLLKSATVRHPGGALGPGVAQEIEHLLKIFSGADITVPIPKQFLLK